MIENRLEWTGERYLPEIGGTIALEHIHRYLVARELAKDKDVLDIASGEGYGTAMLAEVARSVSGVDISAEAVVHATEKYKKENLQFLIGSCAAIPLQSNSIDLVVSFETIEHHDQHQEMMQEIRRILRPDGVLIISSPDKLEYSEKPDCQNEYHVKELYKNEFSDLLATNFKHYHMYGQRVVYGSAILKEDGSSAITSYDLNNDNLLPFAGIAAALYLVAVASDIEPDIIASGILEQPIDQSEYAQWWCNQVSDRNLLISDRDSQIEQLGNIVADSEKKINDHFKTIAANRDEIARLTQSIADRDKQITEFSKNIADRDKQITEFSKNIVDRDKQIIEFSKNIADRDEQIENLINTITERNASYIAHVAQLENAVSTNEVKVEGLLEDLKSLNEKCLQYELNISTLNSELEAVYLSRSWLLTAPLRGRLRTITKLLPPYRFGGKAFLFLRAIFRSLPLPHNLRYRLRKRVLSSGGMFLCPGVSGMASQTVRPQVVLQKTLDMNGLQADSFSKWAEYSVLKSRIDAYAVRSRELLAVRQQKLISISEKDVERVANSTHLKVEEQPIVSIVLPVFGNIVLTLECLSAIVRARVRVSYEIIVADDASPDSTAEVLSLVEGLRVQRNEVNQGFLRNCNAAFPLVRGEYVVILNNDVQVRDGWLDQMLDVFKIHPDAGAVGPKIVYPSGHLQEAGVSFRYDGSSDMIGLNDDPERARYAYTRPVDYCSGAALMLPSKLLRELGGFAEEFVPAYCEDADLCLRLSELGYKIYYAAEASVVHHLSKTMATISTEWKSKQVARNLVHLYNKWAEHFDKVSSVRCIAFYLPQFHTIPENDTWWGEGFTEWTNVRKARPNFVGHYQPREPGELGHYDLSDHQVMEHQAELARRYGIDGFCFYYYWFGGKRLLEKPIEQLLASDSPTFPFCLCWANENWSRCWDGLDRDILISQQHSPEDDRAVILDIIRYFRSDEYIRVDEKPLLLIYRVDLFPDFLVTAKRWREICLEEGIGEIYLAMVESHDLVHQGIDPSLFGCDASVEFPPLNMAESISPSGDLLNDNFSGGIGDYRETAYRYCMRELPSYKRFRGVMPSWDNTARRQNNGFCFEHASPGVFQAWLEFVLGQTRQQMQGDEQLVFINAWNEWAEGAYLEPDARFGHAYLEAVRNAKDASELLRGERVEHIGDGIDSDIALIGHPYSPIGMGEHIRCTHRSLRSVSLNSRVVDIYKLDKPEGDFFNEFSGFIDDRSSKINIFHINGDEVNQAMAHLEYEKGWDGYNIIYPAWELGNYPSEWADCLDRFDEIWAPSKFIKKALEKVCKKNVTHMPLATEIVLSSFLSREYFGIPESDYVFLFFFDARSFANRKNPYAVIEAYKILAKLRPHARMKLVLKINGVELIPDIAAKIEMLLQDAYKSTLIIQQTMADNEVKNLVRCCDCFISLHRAEGYGRGMAEAMVLGKPVVATGYSGNMDFMDSDVAFCIGYKLIPLIQGDYPHFENQVWADPDIDEAVANMVMLIDDPDIGRKIGTRARLHMRKKFGYKAIGNLYRDRLEHVQEQLIND